MTAPSSQRRCAESAQCTSQGPPPSGSGAAPVGSPGRGLHDGSHGHGRRPRRDRTRAGRLLPGLDARAGRAARRDGLGAQRAATARCGRTSRGRPRRSTRWSTGARRGLRRRGSRTCDASRRAHRSRPSSPLVRIPIVRFMYKGPDIDVGSVSHVGPSGSNADGEGNPHMNFKNRGIRGALVAVAVALAVASVPAAGGAADAGQGPRQEAPSSRRSSDLDEVPQRGVSAGAGTPLGPCPGPPDDRRL